MVFRPLHKLTVAALCLCVASLCLGQEKKEKATEPQKEGQANAVKSQGNGLKKLEDDLFKPFKTLSPGTSLDGVFVPPQKPAARPQDDQKLREKRNRDKDWVFMTPDEILGGGSDDQFSNPAGDDKKTKEQKKLSPVEQYYLRSFHLEGSKKEQGGKSDARNKNKSSNSFSRSGVPGSLDEDDENDPALPASLRETQRSLKAFSSSSAGPPNTKA